MKTTIDEWEYAKEQTGMGDIPAAILVLAEAVRHNSTFSDRGGEIFGHELAMALKNVLENSEIKIVQLDPISPL